MYLASQDYRKRRKYSKKEKTRGKPKKNLLKNLAKQAGQAYKGEMMKTLAPVTLKAEPGCVPIPLAVLSSLIGDKAIEAGEFRLKTKTFGMWHIPVSITGVCVSARWINQPWGGRNVSHYTLHGFRTMTKPEPLGYEMEGRLSLNGVKVRAFTSSVLFQIQETGKLVSVGVLFA